MWNMYHQYKTVYIKAPQAASPDVLSLHKKAYESVRHWLLIPKNSISTQLMRKFRQYVIDKNQLTVSINLIRPMAVLKQPCIVKASH